MKHFLLLSLMVSIPAIQVVQAAKSTRRQLRNFQHPAFSMLSLFPGLGSLHGNTECIKGDIVCPSYCIMEDEWGCKSCPCAPANGMQPPTASPQRQAHGSNNEHQCLGTILCMLTCKDGYRLGPRTNDGCQPCECIKKNQTNVDKQVTDGHQTQDCTGAACSASHALENLSKDTSKTSTSKQSGCEWPLCMNGPSCDTFYKLVMVQTDKFLIMVLGANTSTERQNSAPEPGPALPTLPKGGSGSSKGEMIPGIDCLGPACSAKNGMRSFPQSPSATISLKPLPSSPSPDVRTCPSKELCARDCDGTTKLGPPGPDGCPICECILFKVPSALPTRTRVTQPKPTIKTCPKADHCEATCQYGFRIQQLNDRQICPTCECIFPAPPPPSATTKRPNVIGLLKVCQDVVHCMDTCTTGYTLTSFPHEECPRCVCNKETYPEIILPCRDTLSCPNGCTVGYKCDRNGCPTCNCVRPREALLRVEVHTTFTDSGLKCGSRFSCRERCGFGYRTGENGCPTCLCLQPVTVETDTLQLIPTPGPPRQPAVLIPQPKPPQIVVSSSSDCLGPSCSAIHTPGGHRYQFTSAARNSVDNLDNDKGSEHQLPLIVSPPIQDIGAETSHHLRLNITQHEISQPRPSTAMEACPETIQCISRCDMTFELVPIDGHSCPACICKGGESPCGDGSCLKKEHGDVLLSTPSPGQCVAILHCVLTCTEGYDLGEYESNGCPTCKCLDK